jgi:protein translocase SEC61 complex gamma subunit
LKTEKEINMGLRDFLTQCARTLKLAIKPGRSELWLSIKICLLGIGAIGLIGFVIKLLSSVLQPGTSAA